MTTLRKPNHHLHNVRHLHNILAPIMVLPLLITLVTGSIYSIVDLAGQKESFGWLMDWHIGHFGILNLKIIYPLLNALGLLGLVFTGIPLWLQTRHNSSVDLITTNTEVAPPVKSEVKISK